MLSINNRFKVFSNFLIFHVTVKVSCNANCVMMRRNFMCCSIVSVNWIPKKLQQQLTTEQYRLYLFPSFFYFICLK